MEERNAIAEAVAWLRSTGGRDPNTWANAIEALLLGAQMRFTQVGRLVENNKKLRAALKECADDLECELKGQYEGTLDYPSQRHRYERDMASVVEARKLLGANA